jgi:alpha-L-fucosidase
MIRFPSLTKALLTTLLALAPGLVRPSCAQSDNQPERLEWFRDQGFGLFIHWSVDGQLGSTISHSLVGSSEDYMNRFFTELPKTFNPRKFYPQDWAALAKLAGVRYVVFSAKHHSGFCMYRTATTPFNVMETPFRRDITAEVLNAFREQGIAPGLYFSPDDFFWLHSHGITLRREDPSVQPVNNPGLLEYDQAQLSELLSNYGAVDVLFLDGQPNGLKELAWKTQPRIVVTRGALRTPEQYVPGEPLDGPWETCLTMGTQWPYKPTNETYKSGGKLIELLIETRAKGGNLLLNVGPKPDGELPIEQEARLREIALWMFVNGEAIHGVRPWVVTNEGGIWFTKKKDENTVYAIVTQGAPWALGEKREILLRSVASTVQTQVSVLGQNGQALEYHNNVVPRTTWRQEQGGLRINATRAQRLYDDYKWPNAVVLKITNVKPVALPRPAPGGTRKGDPGSRKGS